MSAKWRRSLAWDDEFFPRWAWPAKSLLRAFSSIPLAIVTLSLIAVYSVLASIPIGLLALIPTKLIYGMTILAMVAVVAGAPTWVLARALRPASKPVRFASTFLTAVGLGTIAVVLWSETLWPVLRYDVSTGEGFRLFPEFVAAYEMTTIRRLPGLELTEREFYDWWPMHVLLIGLVVNLVIATVRRIEFIFPNLGVLTVHTGIVVLALGSLYYNALKEEGDTLLLTAQAGPGVPGPPVDHFYDNIETALWVAEEPVVGFEKRRLRGVPRYNDYNTPWSARSLDIRVPDGSGQAVGTDVTFRIVGFAEYAELESAWTPAERAPRGAAPNPLVNLELVSRLPEGADPASPETFSGEGEERVVATLGLPAGVPSDRVASAGGAFSVEHLPADVDPFHWDALTTPVPAGTRHALVVSVEGGEKSVRVVNEGDAFEKSGWRVTVNTISPTPPFPIITPGYEDAESPVALLTIQPPEGEAFTRYVYHRFPAINQDVLGARPDGRPNRRPADPAIRIGLIDASQIQAYIRADGPAAVRVPGGAISTIEATPPGTELDLAPAISLRVADRAPHAERVEIPVNTPEERRERDLIGTHTMSLALVEVSQEGTEWTKRVWVPFSKFMTIARGSERSVALPDGRTVVIGFGRLARPLPGIQLQLVDFEMIPYPHSDVPRDYVSLLEVTDRLRGESYRMKTRLNRPLIHTAPFQWSQERPFIANLLGRIITAIAPNQYKFSQAGWDNDGWRRTKAQAEATGEGRPVASFTILGVGNNPGIYVIAAGAVLVSVGTPWAFYVKPLIMKRRKRKLKEALSAEGAKNGAAHAPPEGSDIP